MPPTPTPTPLLVLLPGLDGTGQLFAPFVRALGPGVECRVVAYPADRFADYDELAEHVLARLPAGPFVLVAESFAGPLAVTVAARRPPGLAGVVLTATFVTRVLPVPYRLARLVVPWLPFRRVPTRWALRVLNAEAPAPAACEEFAAIIDAIPDPVLSGRVLATLRVDARRALADVRVPVLYLQGARDHLVGRWHGWRVRRLCPDAELVRLDAPHFLLQARPAEAARAIRVWAARRGLGLGAPPFA